MRNRYYLCIKMRKRTISTTLRVSAGALLAGALLSLSSCGKDEFRISGHVEGGADKTVALEKADFHGRWMPIDTLRMGSDGKFQFEGARPASPEIYRLALGDRYIYIPVDSTETLKVEATAENFGSVFSITGSQQAEQLAEFEQELMKLDYADSLKRSDFKKSVFTKYLQNAQGSVLSYYVLTKTIDGKPLYDITDRADSKYYAAVATAFEQYRPEDPHGRMLRQASIQAMKKQHKDDGRQRVVEAEEIGYIDIELPDETGKARKLSEFVGNGKRTVMVVGLMNEPESPALNKAISDLYNKMNGSVNFYHISVDDDMYAWRDAARNLPWVTVADPAGVGSQVAVKYNISSMPVFFLFDTRGELVDRATSVSELSKKL